HLHRRGPLPLLADARRPRRPPDRRGPPRAHVVQPRRPSPGPPGGGRHVVRRVGPQRPGRPGCRRFQLLGRAAPSHAPAGAVRPGDKYKYEIIDANGMLRLKADPFAFATEKPPGTASVVFESQYTWNDDEWIAARTEGDPLHTPFAVYECHLGSWRTVPEEAD